MTERIGGFKLDTARKLAEIARERGHTGTVQYPKAPSSVAGYKVVEFALTEALTTAMATATADITAQYGTGATTPTTAITVRNPMGQAFSGASGAKGLAFWNTGSEFIIVQLECP